MTTRILDQHLEITPGVCSGKPRIAGHRITVENIAIWQVRLGMSVDEIADEYELTLGDIYAALAYYFDHRKKVDASIAADDQFAEELRRRTRSILAAKNAQGATRDELLANLRETLDEALEMNHEPRA